MKGKKFQKFLSVVLCLLLIASFAPLNSAIPASTVSAKTKVSISAKKVTLAPGKTKTLKIKGNKKKVKWSSNKKSVATVSSKGKVKAKKAGKAVITAKIGKKSYKCTVTVKNMLNVPKKSVVFNQEGDTVTIPVYLYGYGNVTYQIGNTNVVNAQWMAASGNNIPLKLTATGKGTTSIAITNSLSNEKYNIAVTVNKDIDRLSTIPSSITVNEEATIDVGAKGKNAVNISVSNSDYVSASWKDDRHLQLIGKKVGNTTLTIRESEKGQSKTVRVTVTNKKTYVKITKPSLPITLSVYNYKSSLTDQVMITGISFEETHYSYNNTNSVKMNVSGQIVYRSTTTGKISPVSWRLKDNSGNVVESGTLYTPSLFVDDTFANAYTYISSCLADGNYTLELYNTTS